MANTVVPDLTGVTDNNLWEYGATLRKMVEEKGYKCIDFVRIMNLVDLHKEATITKERFISLLEPSRRELMDKYGDPNFDANACIKNDPDYKMTYDGYAKFLKKDLAYSVMKGQSLSGKKWKAKVHETAKAMIARGVVSATTPARRFRTLPPGRGQERNIVHAETDSSSYMHVGLCRANPGKIP